ncbi:reverse transcriptase domain-containing protein [Tanacetum coccineum]
MGPFPSSRGNKYILMAIDNLSKWVEAKELPTIDARVVVKFLKSLFTRFGTPHAIISDRDTHFYNDQFAKVMLKTVGENRASWSNKLDDALWAFCTSFKTPIGCSPYKLVYRKACHLPIELEHNAYWALKHYNFDLKSADPTLDPPLMKTEELKQVDVIITKPLIEEPPELELKDLPSNLEYSFLEGTDKLPVIIAKDLKEEEKVAL